MDLRSICEQLTCANLLLRIEDQLREITLTLIDCDTADEFVFHCKGIHICRITQFPEETNELYGVGEVRVYRERSSIAISPGWVWAGSDQIDDFWIINIKGLVEIEITCMEFEWDMKGHSS